VRIKSYTEAVRIANAAGIDAAKKRMRKAGRKVMSADDRNHGVDVVERILVDLGFDVPGWIATAGVVRNMPDEKPKAARRKRADKQAPVQLSFAFG
jgi:hypothetical protein